MTQLFVTLSVTPHVQGIYLNQLCGTDEMSVEDAGTKTAISLLEGLIAKEKKQNLSGDFHATKIVTADRDRIFARLYIAVYGSKVDSTVSCENCEKEFDLDFSIADLLNHYQLLPGQLSEDGICQLEPGLHFRLPTGEDELVIADLAAADAENMLMERCLVSGNVKNDRERIQEKMAEIAPVLNLDMQANCPECAYVQQVRFDIQSFLLMKLKQERTRLITEIHKIALNYHWSPEAILALPRNIRKQYVALIESNV